MFPLGDLLPTLRRPVITIALILVLAAVWLLVQGAAGDPRTLAASVCELGLIPGELTGRAAPGTAIQLGAGMVCVVGAHDAMDYLTLLTSMFIHGGWAHIIGNAWFLWVFGNNVEDSMGRARYLAFYLVCGLAAALAQVAIDPGSPVPVVGASGAISGVMGAYLVLYPRAQVKTLFIIIVFIRIIPLPAWFILVYWFALQFLAALPQIAGAETAASSGVAVVAHVAGFVTGAVLAKLFANDELVDERVAYSR
jgi:membrane associated rhomboid family serine protease